MEEQVACLRETSRSLLKLNRRFQRDEESDNRRSVTNTSITPAKIEAISNKLKTKLSISGLELITLKNGLIEDAKYIEAVLNTHGALRGLIRELTGSNMKKQLESAGCICNLALGDSKAGMAVAKVAGTYLIATSDSLSVELSITSTWAIGNIASTGLKASQLLLAQGALTKLCELMLNSNEEVSDAASYALVHLCYQLADNLGLDYLTKTLDTIYRVNFDVTKWQLAFILSCHKDFNQVLQENYIREVVRNLKENLDQHQINCSNNCTKNCCLLFVLRILGNVKINDRNFSIITNSINEVVLELKLLMLRDTSNKIVESLFWFLGNLYNYCESDKFFVGLLR